MKEALADSTESSLYCGQLSPTHWKSLKEENVSFGEMCEQLKFRSKQIW